MCQSKNGLQPQLIRYGASIEADHPNQSFTLSVNGRYVPELEFFSVQKGTSPTRLNTKEVALKFD